MSDKPLSKKAKGYYERRLLAIKENYGELIGQTKQALAKDRDNILLRVELVDAYELSGQYGLAKDEVMRLGYEIQEPAKENGSEPAQRVPCWIPLRATALKNKMKHAEKQTD